jgi:hypothetical protein
MPDARNLNAIAWSFPNPPGKVNGEAPLPRRSDPTE